MVKPLCARSPGIAEEHQVPTVAMRFPFSACHQARYKRRDEQHRHDHSFKQATVQLGIH
jgi:hypothetical protein